MASRKYTLKLRSKLMIALLFLGYFAFLMFHQEWEIHKQQANIMSLEHHISQVQQDNEILSRQILATESELYIEQTARERLGWVKEGEIIFIEKNKP